MAEQMYDFQKRMLQVHRPNRRMDKQMHEGQIEITSEWSIIAPDDKGLLDRVALDLKDYFSVSMGVDLTVVCENRKGNTITYEIDASLEGEGAYCVEVQENAVRLTGRDERAVAQASYLLEDLINFEEAPYLSLGRNERRPIMRCRMVHSGYAEDNYPDEHLNAIAHSGVNAILVFVCDVDSSPTHSFSFNELIARAERFGLDVYAYSYMKSRLHPDDEGAEEFYDSLYGNLFRKCPGFKGVVLVGESVEFPSKDPRTSGMLRLDNIGPDGKQLIGKPNPGWFPCFDYPVWLDMIKKIIRRERCDADIVFWTYNWGYCDEADRLALIDRLPRDISLEVTFEMFEDGERLGVPTRSTDYTASFPYPGKYFLSEADAAARRGIPLYSMTNAGGLTWDVGVVPYEPAPGVWSERYRHIRDCHEKYGLCGSMESHHYGFYPSFISELAKAYFTETDPDGETILNRLIVRDWGEENLTAVRRAYTLFDEGVYNIITGIREQYGPLRIGPAYPLVLFDDEDIELPRVEGSHRGGNRICIPFYKTDKELLDPREREIFDLEIDASRICAERMLEGAGLLRNLLSELPEHKRDEATRIVGVAEFMGRTFLTSHHLRRWYKEKMAIAHGEGDRKEHLETLRAIAEEEILNVYATFPLVDFDSRLGFEPSMDYMGHRANLEWKLGVTERILREEIPRLEGTEH